MSKKERKDPSESEKRRFKQVLKYMQTFEGVKDIDLLVLKTHVLIDHELNEITNKVKLENRTYPAIKLCIANRYKIVTGIFAVYAFIASSLNKHKEIINQDVSLFAAWTFTIFVILNTWNYVCNAWEQDKLEGSDETNMKRVWRIVRVEGLFAVTVILLIWIGYWRILKKLYVGI